MSNPAKNFEDLDVYQKARKLTNAVYACTRNGSFARDRGLIDQIRRASVSVMSNIAEGFERNSNADLINFLYIAKGSCGEVRAQLTIAFDQNYIDKQTLDSLDDLARHVSSMLSKLIEYIRKSPYKGMRYERKSTVSKEFQAMLDKLTPKFETEEQ